MKSLVLCAVCTLPAAAHIQTRTLNVGDGWARNSINTSIFRQSALCSHGHLQYVSYYDQDGRVVLARRRMPSGKWQILRTQYTGNVRDAHNGISIGVDGSGLVHIAWDHHGGPLHYAQGKAPDSLELTEQMPMTGVDETHVTYPEFFTLPDGDLLMMYRSGSSGNGDVMLNRWDHRRRTWSIVHHPFISGQAQRNAYTNQIAVGSDGSLHITWCWRETGDAATNHDICYARSCDTGKTWTRSDGTIYTLPITQDTAEVIRRIPQGRDLINTTTTCLDTAGHPMMAGYWREADSPCPQYRLVWFDGKGWRMSRITDRDQDFRLSGLGTKRVPISRPKLAADKQGRVYMLFRDELRRNRVSVALSEDPAHARWRFFDLADDSVGLWEPNYDVERWHRTGELHIFVQRVGQGDGEKLEDVAPQPVRVLIWKPNGRSPG
ncbi:MAG: BNR repeat-containing protein [Armatimonadetes bacterium]|nr:BNR repeat-containing protein [Armatimonadota bacterium]